jgi:O-antigen/teichoic acid export membrane protein
MTELNRFFKHTSVYAVGNMAQRGAGFLLLPLYTSRLTTGEYGVLELFYSASAILSTLLGVGLAHATLRFYFEYNDSHRRRAVVSTSLVATLAIALPPALLLLAFAKPISGIVFNGRYVYGIPIILTTMVLELLRQVCLAYLRAREYSVRYVLCALSQLVVQVVANIYTVAVLRWGVEGVLLGNMLAVLTGTAYLLSVVLSFAMSSATAIPSC